MFGVAYCMKSYCIMIASVIAFTGCPSSNKAVAEPTDLAEPAEAVALPQSPAPGMANAPPGDSSQKIVTVASAVEAAVGAPPPAPFDLSKYPWHANDSLELLPVHDDLLRRFPPPSGFVRERVGDGSFGAWLRRLPLASPGTPVLSFRGATILPGDHPNLGAVATLDIGTADLQQCADAIMRLHAEWKWSKGERDMSYRAASGLDLPFSRWERGERVVMKGKSIEWVRRGVPSKDDHSSFRKYLDAVFAWANTVSLARQATEVDLEGMRPGDFFILPGNPGHTVLVLDLARDATGRKAVLLGQSYMPAQSFQVLRPNRGESWFVLEPEAGGIKTPFWPKPFPWTSIRRLD